MSRFVRASKYRSVQTRLLCGLLYSSIELGCNCRHVFGQAAKKENGIENVKITSSAWDTNLCSASGVCLLTTDQLNVLPPSDDLCSLFPALSLSFRHTPTSNTSASITKSVEVAHSRSFLYQGHLSLQASHGVSPTSSLSPEVTQPRS